jgi:hypothetical protein
MADTTTTNLGLTKPEVGASSDTWGGKLNTNLDTIDGIFAGAGSGTSVGLNVGTGKTLTVGGTQNMSALTASTALALDASKNVVSVTNTGTGNNVLSASPTFTGTISGAAASLSGNLTFSSTAQRITGDMSNATFSSRLAFQSSTTNGNTNVTTLPNGTSTSSGIQCYNAADPTNAAFANIGASSAEIQFLSAIRGTGTYLPMTFYTGGSERMRLDTSGNLGIGTTSPGAKLQINGSTAQYSPSVAVRTAPNQYEWGHPNTSGYGSVIGAESGSGASFIAFNSGAGTNSNTYRTFGIPGSVFRADNAGGLGLYRVTTASADNQSLTGPTAFFDSSGNVGIGTASPLAWLQVGAGTNAVAMTGTQLLSVKTSGASAGVSAKRDGFAEVGMQSGGGGGYVGTWTNDVLNIVTNGTSNVRMVVDTSGNVGIGGTAQAYSRLNLLGTYPTSSNATQVVRLDGTIPSGTTASYRSFLSRPVTQATAFTLTNLIHFEADTQTLGAGSAVTNQYGFSVADSLTGATNNYGFYSNIASGSNRWNFYAAGTAQNYFAGDVGIGRTPVYRLHVQGSTTTSANYALVVENAGAAANLFYVRNDGLMMIGNAANSPYSYTTGNAANLYVDAGGLVYRSTSSLRYKSDVTDATHGLADVLKLRSVTYKAKNSGDTVFGGLIAEEVHDAGLTEFVAYDKEGRPDAIHYGNMVALLVKAVQELTARVAELEAK